MSIFKKNAETDTYVRYESAEVSTAGYYYRQRHHD